MENKTCDQGNYAVQVACFLMFCSIWRYSLKPPCRPVHHQHDKDQHCRSRETYRIYQHEACEVPVMWEYGEDPGESCSADADGCQDRRDEGDSEAAEVAGHHFVEHAEGICRKDDQQSRIADFNNLRIAVKE